MASAQVHPRDFSIGGFVGGQLADAATSMRELAKHKRNWTADVRAARQRFWTAYPNGADLPAAAAAFNQLLREKDLHYLVINLADRMEFGSARGGAAGLIDALTGDVDGGIRAAGREAFVEWANAVEASATQRIMGFAVVTAEAIEAPKSVEAYQRYTTIRDNHELLAGPHSPLRSTDPRLNLGAVFWFAMKLPNLRAGTDQYDAMLPLVGEKIVSTLASDLRQYPRNAEGSLDYISGKGWSGVTPDNPRLYLVLVQARYTNKHDWVKARAVYDDLVKTYGQARVHAFATKVQASGQLFECPPSAGGASCLHAVFANGEESYFAGAAQRKAAADAAEAQRKVAADAHNAPPPIEPRYAQPDAEFLKTREYWEWKVSQEMPRAPTVEREAYIFQGRWRNIATEPIPPTVEKIGTFFADFQLRIQVVSSPGNMTQHRNWWAFTNANLKTLREECTSTGRASSVVCQLQRLTEETVELYRPRPSGLPRE
jgi:hypothetical protein